MCFRGKGEPDEHKDNQAKPDHHHECPFVPGSCVAAAIAHKNAMEAHRACIEQKGYAQAEMMCAHG
jgi:hypothetical protein